MIVKIAQKILGKETVSALYKLIDPKIKLEKKRIKSRETFYAKLLKKGDLCFDVGANLGNRTEPLLAIGAKVIAVEPQESCYQFLEQKFKNKIQIVKKGLCEKECVRTFHISNASTISSFSEEWINSVKEERFVNNTWDKTVEVEMTTLDNLIEEFGNPEFIKIDVEGYELEVLKGLTKRIPLISFEYTVPEQTSKINDCIDQIFKNNAQIKCNFCEDENTEWALTEWLSVESFFGFINSGKFTKPSFGDIYVKDFS